MTEVWRGPVTFFVQGLPKAMSVGKSIRAGNRVFQTRNNTPWATLVGMMGRHHAPAMPSERPIIFKVFFYLPRPKSRKKDAYPVRRPDLDNLAHKLSDSWNGVFWVDDSQIVTMLIEKHYAHGHIGAKFIIDEVLAEGGESSGRIPQAEAEPIRTETEEGQVDDGAG